METLRLDKSKWYDHLSEEVKKAKTNPTLSRNDIIRPFRIYSLHLERLPEKDHLKSIWVKIQISVNPIIMFVPFREILRKASN